MLRNSSPTRACTSPLDTRPAVPSAGSCPPAPAPPAPAMPPKKNQNVKDDNVLLLGRIGTNLKVGIVGLPNVGSVNQLLLSLQNTDRLLLVPHTESPPFSTS